MATELFNRYFWLMDVIYRSGGITREDINRKWAFSALNDKGEDELPERTFHRYRKAVEELFEVDIVCRGGKYQIEDVGIIPDEISDIIKSAASIVKTNYESCQYSELSRIDYIADLMLNPYYKCIEQKTFENATEILYIVLSSAQHQCLDEELKLLKNIFTSYSGSNKWYLLTGNDNSLECEIQIKIIAINSSR